MVLARGECGEKKFRIRHKISLYNAKQWEDHRRIFNGKCGQTLKLLFLYYSGGLHRLNVSGLTINTFPLSLLHFKSVYINPTFAEAVNTQ